MPNARPSQVLQQLGPTLQTLDPPTSPRNAFHSGATGALRRLVLRYRCMFSRYYDLHGYFVSFSTPKGNKEARAGRSQDTRTPSLGMVNEAGEVWNGHSARPPSKTRELNLHHDIGFTKHATSDLLIFLSCVNHQKQDLLDSVKDGMRPTVPRG